jgi:hypothetical protein
MELLGNASVNVNREIILPPFLMRVNVCFSIMIHFFLTVFENDSYSRHVENSFGYVYAPQTYTIKRLPWKVSVTEM